MAVTASWSVKTTLLILINNTLALGIENPKLSCSSYAELTICNHSCLQHLKGKGESPLNLTC